MVLTNICKQLYKTTSSQIYPQDAQGPKEPLLNIYNNRVEIFFFNFPSLVTVGGLFGTLVSNIFALHTILHMPTPRVL